MVEVGARVGAILKATTDEVHLLGFGVYDGEHEPPVGPWGLSLDDIKAMKEAGDLPPDWSWKNPRITLDDGRVVWGYQCWWGSEESINKKIEGMTIIPAVIPTSNGTDVAS